MNELQGMAIKTSPWKVRALAELKRDGKLHLPDLQRGFRWSGERIRALLDSLYRRYPVGALLLWKPTWSSEEAPFKTRAWDIWPPRADGKGERQGLDPIKQGALFVLDGQQRLTSLFRIIFRSRGKGKETPDPDLLVALSADEEWIEAPFHLRSKALTRQMKEGLLISAEVLFEGVRGGDETAAILKAIAEWVKPGDPVFTQALNRANAIRNAILENEVVAYEVDANAEDDNVIEIFARLNQQGVTLRPSELAAARLTGHMADFREKARKVLNHEDFNGFTGREGQEDRVRTGGFVDTDLLIRTALFLTSNNIRYRELESKKSDAKEAGFAQVAQVWDQACRAVRESVNMFKNAGIPEGKWIPYRYLLLSPAIAAAKGNLKTPDQWLGWALAASLWGHHAGNAETKAQNDAVAAAQGSIDELLKFVKTQAKRPESAIPQEDDFTENVVRDSGVLFALLVHFIRTNARSFPAGKLLGSHAEPLEVHHIFPRAVLNTYPEDNDFVPDRLGNLTLLFRSDNETIGDTEPTVYLGKLPEEYLRAHAIPLDPNLWTVSKYQEFCLQRERLVAKILADLLTQLGVS